MITNGKRSLVQQLSPNVPVYQNGNAPTWIEQTFDLVDWAASLLKNITLPSRKRNPVTPSPTQTPSLPVSNKFINWLKTGQTIPLQDSKLTRRKVRTQRTFLISIAALGCSTVGALGFSLFYLIGGAILIYESWPMCKVSFVNLRHGKIDISTLYLVIMSGLILTGQFWVGNLTMFMYAISEKLMLFATDNTQKELIDVFKVHPDFVWLVVEGVEIRKPFESLQAGDIVAVHAGEMIPADGTVVAGIATVDQHVLTGESQPAEKEIGQPVFSTTILLSGSLQIKVERAGGETIVAKIGQILNETTDFKSTVQMRSQELSDKTVLPTLLLGAASLPIVGANGALAIVFAHFKAKMNATAPLSALNYFKTASKQGIVFKDGRSLDLLYEVDTIVFDKTGTLTQEEPSVTQIHLFQPTDTEEDILRYAASAETKQTHPVAKAIIKAARYRQLTLFPLDNAEYKIGYGLQVVINQRRVHVGSLRFMELEAIPIADAIYQCVAACNQQAHTLVLVAVEQTIIGALELVATLRPEAHQVVHQLRQLPQIKSMYIISGDHEAPTKQLAHALGIDHYFAETLPQHKAQLIEQLQQEGKSICYIGDGINDSIALRKAQVSVSLRGASTIATDTAQIVLMDGGLQHLPTLFAVAHSFRKNINLMFGITLAPMIFGIVGVFFSSFGLVHIVIINKVGLLGALWVAMAPAWYPLQIDKNAQELEKQAEEKNDSHE